MPAGAPAEKSYLTEPRTRAAPWRRRVPPLLLSDSKAGRQARGDSACAGGCNGVRVRTSRRPAGCLVTAVSRSGFVLLGKFVLALGKQCPSALHRALEGADAVSLSPQAAVEAPLPGCARLGGRTPARHRLSLAPSPRIGRHLRRPLCAAPMHAICRVLFPPLGEQVQPLFCLSNTRRRP